MDLAPEARTFTVEEAAKILRIGRTAAYALAREWRTTNGRSGLPVLELGRTLRVPRAALERLLHLPAIEPAGHARPRDPARSTAPTPSRPSPNPARSDERRVGTGVGTTVGTRWRT